MKSAQELFELWRSHPSLDPALQKELTAMQNDSAAIDDAFGAALQFGTGGLRGMLGVGTSRMNVHVVRRAAQAVADYLNETSLPKRAAIGYDSRINSERFARETAAFWPRTALRQISIPDSSPFPP